MDRKLGVIYVCTANGGRSPNAQTQGRAYVNVLGLDDKIEITSAGSHAALLQDDVLNFPVEHAMKIIGFAQGKGTFHARAREVAGRLLEDVDGAIAAVEEGDENVKDDVRYLAAYLKADEIAKRTAVLLERGLVPGGMIPEREFHRQFVPSSDYDLVLAMKDENAKVCGGLYAESGITPVPKIVPVCEYAGIDGGIDDPFGGNLDDFRACTDRIGEATRKSIDRAVREFGV